MVVAQVYAKALFELAIENNNLDQIFTQVKFAMDNLFTNGEFKDIMLNPNIGFEDKKILLGKVFDKESMVSDFFLLLIEKNRFLYVEDMFHVFLDEYYRYKNIVNAKVFSVKMLEESVLEQIRKILGSKLKSTVKLENIIDDSLVGGFIVKVNETVIDVSIKSELENFKGHMLQLRL